MNQKLAKSARSVQEALQKAGLECKVMELQSSTRTALDAATSIGCDVSHIVKSLIFKTKETGRPVLVLASGATRVNEKQLESLTGESIIKADADYTREITGFAIGGIPPIGHKSTIDFIFIDRDLIQCDELWAAAGTPHAVFSIRSKDLLALTNGTVVQLS